MLVIKGTPSGVTFLNHTEPVLHDGFSGALERVVTALYVQARSMGLEPCRRAVVMARPHPYSGELQVVGRLDARPAPIPAPEPVDPWERPEWVHEPPC